MTTQTSAPSTTLQEQVYKFVKAKIINLALKPGQYVTDSEVASQLGISRTPVREGLRRLEHEGLLTSEARRGWKVYALSLADVREIFDLKEAVEGMIARRAAACTEEALRSALQGSIAEMRRAVETDDVEAWLEADVEFHRVLFAMCENDRAMAIVKNLNDQWHRVRLGFVALQGRTRRSSREHSAIAESILSGNGSEAERLMRVHLHNVRAELMRLLENLVLPFVQEGV